MIQTVLTEFRLTRAVLLMVLIGMPCPTMKTAAQSVNVTIMVVVKKKVVLGQLESCAYK